MKWENMTGELHEESRKLEGMRPDLTGLDSHAQAQALLALEARHHVTLTQAVKSRVANGVWPEGLTFEQRYILRLRILWLEQHIVWLEVWGAREAETVEQILTVFADREWHRFRFAMHVEWISVVPSSVNDPFADPIQSRPSAKAESWWRSFPALLSRSA